MPIYEKPPVEVREVCDRMLEKYHGPLKDAGVKVDLLFARTDPEKDEAVALKLHGYRANAIVKVVAYKLRVQDHGDAEILIDGDEWFTWKDEEKDAILDHELEHLELKLDKEGNVVRDDLDRPKLRLRLHDHEFGWFDSIARRHGKASFEVQQYERFQEAHQQLWMDFEDEKPQAGDAVMVVSGGRKRKFKDSSEAADFIVDDVTKKFRGSTRKAASKRK
jgi:hypothetical protein